MHSCRDSRCRGSPCIRLVIVSECFLCTWTIKKYIHLPFLSKSPLTPTSPTSEYISNLMYMSSENRASGSRILSQYSVRFQRDSMQRQTYTLRCIINSGRHFPSRTGHARLSSLLGLQMFFFCCCNAMHVFRSWWFLLVIVIFLLKP